MQGSRTSTTEPQTGLLGSYAGIWMLTMNQGVTAPSPSGPSDLHPKHQNVGSRQQTHSLLSLPPPSDDSDLRRSWVRAMPAGGG